MSENPYCRGHVWNVSYEIPGQAGQPVTLKVSYMLPLNCAGLLEPRGKKMFIRHPEHDGRGFANSAEARAYTVERHLVHPYTKRDPRLVFANYDTTSTDILWAVQHYIEDVYDEAEFVTVLDEINEEDYQRLIAPAAEVA